jgi:hypothetical protein
MNVSSNNLSELELQLEERLSLISSIEQRNKGLYLDDKLIAPVVLKLNREGNKISSTAFEVKPDKPYRISWTSEPVEFESMDYFPHGLSKTCLSFAFNYDDKWVQDSFFWLIAKEFFEDDEQEQKSYWKKLMRTRHFLTRAVGFKLIEA